MLVQEHSCLWAFRPFFIVIHSRMQKRTANNWKTGISSRTKLISAFPYVKLVRLKMRFYNVSRVFGGFDNRKNVCKSRCTADCVHFSSILRRHYWHMRKPASNWRTWFSSSKKYWCVFIGQTCAIENVHSADSWLYPKSRNFMRWSFKADVCF